LAASTADPKPIARTLKRMRSSLDVFVVNYRATEWPFCAHYKLFIDVA
jgi:hypothetical protein